jgi:hypothetical protein
MLAARLFEDGAHAFRGEHIRWTKACAHLRCEAPGLQSNQGDEDGD